MTKFLILELNVSQGFVDLIQEIALFDSLEEAKTYWVEHSHKLQEEGHHWSGLTTYRLAALNEKGEYEDIPEEKPIFFGFFGAGMPPVIKKQP